MKKRFLPFSLLLVIMILGQSISIADNGGHYVPRTQGTASSEQFMSDLRANQHTGLIDPAWMLKAAQSQTTRGAADDPLYWLTMGPDNMGGQTTAVIYDNHLNSHGTANGVVYIGSKGGGVYKTYNYGITWHQVDNKDLMVSCMVQDADGVIYVGTGDGGAAVSYNGLDEEGYDNSFVGSGVYTIKNDVISVLPSTAPSANEVSPWSFVNDLAIAGNTLLAATNEGLMFSVNKGETWTMALEGKCDEVTVSGDDIVVSCDGMIYIGTIDNLECHSAATIQHGDGDTIIALPKAAGLLDIAVSPSDPKTIYAAAVGTNGNHSGVYVSYDKGVNWFLALAAIDPSVGGHTIYSGYGLYNHGIVVDPSNNGKVYVLGYNLWSLERPASGEGLFIARQLTDGGSHYYYASTYLHVGLHTMVFNPDNSKECYIGTDGGIYKATLSGEEFSFNYCNRNYITTRMTNVAVSGKAKRIIASGLDHGSVLIAGEDGTNTEGHGVWVNPSGYNMGMFDDAAQGGPCAISLINPNTIFVTYKDGNLERSETAGEDWVSTNFTSSDNTYPITLSSVFRTPILLFENFDDQNNIETVWYKNTTGNKIPAGTTLQIMSNNNYPFDYTLTSALHDRDSIEVHDPITAKLYVACSDEIYLTRIPLLFAKETEWTVVSKKSLGFQGDPLCMAISADGDNLFVGTKQGGLYRLSNLNTVVDSLSSSNSDTVNFKVTTTVIELAGTGQCVTSVAVDPRDANKVVVTLGNYGNDAYVYYSTNALSDEPTFVSKQANLPKMPVYSSLIEMTTGHVILGTERGIYRAKNINNADWITDGEMMGEVPVMELKQQIVFHEDHTVVLASPEDTVVNFYPGVKNTGIIYAATYGRGAFRCENYKLYSGTDIPETPVVVENTVSIYPNPASTQATVKFETLGNVNVSYQVYDLSGRMVMNQNLGRMTEGAHEVNVNTSNLSTGSYILRLNQGGNSSTVKFLVY